MKLTPTDVARFFNTWVPLLHYVNQKRKLVKTFPATWAKQSVDAQDILVLRDALWADDTLREAFIRENPVGLPAENLALVESWQHRVAGKFFIFRHLKKYSVFLSANAPVRAYGVLGITDSIPDVIGPYTPLMVEAVLLPFDDRIIYDSLLAPYSVYFGGGIKREFAESYRNIQERSGVITSLLPDVAARPDKKGAEASNKQVLKAFEKALAQSGLSVKMIAEHSAALTDFAGFLLEQNPPALLLDVTIEDVDAYAGTRGGKVNLVSFKRFLWFLRDSDRIDYDEAEALLDALKRRQHK